jgi:hypothetical protein
MVVILNLKLTHWVNPANVEHRSKWRTSVYLTLSDPMSDLVRHYDFLVPDAFLDL